MQLYTRLKIKNALNIFIIAFNIFFTAYTNATDVAGHLFAGAPLSYGEWSSDNGAITSSCPVDWTCENSGNITGDGFLQRKISDPQGNEFFQTIVIDQDATVDSGDIFHDSLRLNNESFTARDTSLGGLASRQSIIESTDSTNFIASTRMASGSFFDAAESLFIGQQVQNVSTIDPFIVPDEFDSRFVLLESNVGDTDIWSDDPLNCLWPEVCNIPADNAHRTGHHLSEGHLKSKGHLLGKGHHDSDDSHGHGDDGEILGHDDQGGVADHDWRDMAINQGVYSGSYQTVFASRQHRHRDQGGEYILKGQKTEVRSEVVLGEKESVTELQKTFYSERKGIYQTTVHSDGISFPDGETVSWTDQDDVTSFWAGSRTSSEISGFNQVFGYESVEIEYVDGSDQFIDYNSSSDEGPWFDPFESTF